MLNARSHRLHALAVPLDRVFMHDALGHPSAQMREHAGWDGDRRLPFFRGDLALWQSIKDAVLEIHEYSAIAGDRRRCRDRGSPRAAVETNEDKTGEVAQWPLVGANLPAFVPTPVHRLGLACPRQHTRSRAAVLSFPGQPARARCASCGQDETRCSPSLA